MYGGWPIKVWEAVSAEDQVRFWQDGARGKGKIEASLVSTIKRTVISQKSASLAGDFLPLSVYAQKGFDTTMIEQLCAPEDRDVHPILGPVFKVNIRRESDSTIENSVREQLCELRQNKSTIGSASRKAIGLSDDEEESQEPCVKKRKTKAKAKALDDAKTAKELAEKQTKNGERVSGCVEAEPTATQQGILEGSRTWC
jgi:hypothetical protein